MFSTGNATPAGNFLFVHLGGYERYLTGVTIIKLDVEYFLFMRHTQNVLYYSVLIFY